MEINEYTEEEDEEEIEDDTIRQIAKMGVDDIHRVE